MSIIHRKNSGALLLLVVALSVSVGMAADNAPVREFQIAAQPLDQALRQFALSSGMDLLFAPELVAGRTSSGVNGAYSVDDALGTLLTGTGLRFSVSGSRVVISRSDKVGLEAGSGEAVRVAQTDTATKAGELDYAKGKEGSGQEVKLEEIVVTAQKRKERLQDVPTSMVALQASKLEALGMTQLSDYAKLTPGLVIIGGGGPSQGQPVLRGITAGHGGDRNSSVGMYLDDVSFTPSSTRFQGTDFNFDPALADIDRIEVLKGPQSTLYGASTVGGLIKYVSKKPNLTEYEGSTLISGSQLDAHDTGYGARLSGNIPLVADKLAVRGSVFYRKDPGYIGDLVRGKQDANSDTLEGGRLSILFNVNDTLETSLSGFFQRTNADGSSFASLDSTTLRPIGGDPTYTQPVAEKQEFNYRMVASNTSWRLPFATLTNVAGYSMFSADSFNDISFFAPFFGVSTVIWHNDRSSERFSDELRLASQPGGLEWLLAGFYTHERVFYPETMRGGDANGIILPSTAPGFGIDNYLTTATFREKALFGDLTYHFTDQLEATVGVRHSANNQDFTTQATGLLRTIDTGFGVTDSATNYLATVSYKPTRDVTMYLRAASAYRPGGPNSLNIGALAAGTPSGYSADTLRNYEAGVHGNAWNGVFSYSAAIYHMDWSDIQVNLVYTVPGTTFAFGYTGNGAKATSDGAELALTVTPLSGLTLEINGAYNKTEITDAAGLDGATNGEALPYTPKWTGTALVDYRRKLSGDLTGLAGLTYAHTGALVTGFQSQNPYHLDAYSILDLRTGIEWSRYSLIARVDNATNHYAVTTTLTNDAVSTTALNGINGPVGGTLLRPRTFGLTFEARF